MTLVLLNSPGTLVRFYFELIYIDPRPFTQTFYIGLTSRFSRINAPNMNFTRNDVLKQKTRSI